MNWQQKAMLGLYALIGVLLIAALIHAIVTGLPLDLPGTAHPR